MPSCFSCVSWSYGLLPARLHCPWDSIGKNTGVGCHALLQGTFWPQGWNLHLLPLLVPGFGRQEGSLPLAPPMGPRCLSYVISWSCLRFPGCVNNRHHDLFWAGLCVSIECRSTGYRSCLEGALSLMAEIKVSESRSVLSDSLQRRKKVKSLSRVGLSATPWTVAYQTPLSMGLPRQEYRSGLPFPSPGHLPHPGIETRSPTL